MGRGLVIGLVGVAVPVVVGAAVWVVSRGPSQTGTRVFSPFWATAPLVLLRHPGLFAAVAVGALLLALVAVSAQLFLSAATSRVLEAHLRDPVVTRWGAGLSYQSSGVSLEGPLPDGSPAAPYERQMELFSERAARMPHLGPVVVGILGPEMSVSVAGGSEVRSARLMGRTGNLAHVAVLEGRDGDGVWLSDLTARGIGAEPGDTLVFGTANGPPVEIVVDGIYQALSSAPDDGYWRAWERDIHPACRDCPLPPPFVLGEVEQVVALTRTMGAKTAAVGLDAPLAARLRPTLEEAREVERFAEAFGREISDRSSDLHEVFRCCGFQYTPPRTRTSFVSNMPQVLSQVERRIVAVEGPVQVLLAAGLGVALAVLAGAALFTSAARRVEGTLLFARGQRTSVFGAKAALEAIVPAGLGAATGVGGGLLLVGTIGPEGPIGGPALRWSGLVAILTAPLAAALIGGVSALWFSRLLGEHRTGPAWAARVPWEVAPLAVGIFLLARLRRAGAFVHDPQLDFARPSPLLLVAPVLAIAGVAAAGARIFRAGAARVRTGAGALGHPAYLAVHRVASAPALVLLLVAGSALSLGTFVHAQTITRSLQETVQAKARVFVGSDAQVAVDASREAPEGFPLPVTKVARTRSAGTLEPGGKSFDLLAVDPETLAAAAYWRDEFSDLPLAALADALRGEGTPVVVSGADGAVATRAVEIAGRHIPVEVVGEASAFPGTSSERPLVVVDAATLREAYGGSDPPRLPNTAVQLWIRGDPPRARAALRAVGIFPEGFLTAEEVMDVPGIAAVVDTLGVLNVLSAAAGILVVAVLLLYLQARQRAQVVAHALSRRMGLGESGHRRALLLELTALLGVASLTALGVGLVTSRLVSPLLDPLGTISPEPLYLPPWLRLAAALTVLAVAAWAGARVVSHRAREARLGEVLRVAD